MRYIETNHQDRSLTYITSAIRPQDCRFYALQIDGQNVIRLFLITGDARKQVTPSRAMWFQKPWVESEPWIIEICRWIDAFEATKSEALRTAQYVRRLHAEERRAKVPGVP